MSRPEITFTLQYMDTVVEVSTYWGEFRSLMDLVNEKIFVEDFGECRGIGRCGTCLVQMQTKKPLPEKDRNEASTLEKAGMNQGEWRLSCQLMIDDTLQNAVVTVADERVDVR